MKPHIIPRVILKQFRIGAAEDSPVLVMKKATMEFRARGVNHSTFLAPSNYLGNGRPGTLENELAIQDEPSIRTLIDWIRKGLDITKYLPEIKFLLGNNSARNPVFRTHPKVKETAIHSPEEFHTIAMDHFPDQYIEYPVDIIHIKTDSYSFILPDFSLTHMVLSPDIAIVRFNKKDRTEHLKLAKEEEFQFVMNYNRQSYINSQSWIVSNSKHLLESYGGVEK